MRPKKTVFTALNTCMGHRRMKRHCSGQLMLGNLCHSESGSWPAASAAPAPLLGLACAPAEVSERGLPPELLGGCPVLPAAWSAESEVPGTGLADAAGPCCRLPEPSDAGLTCPRRLLAGGLTEAPGAEAVSELPLCSGCAGCGLARGLAGGLAGCCRALGSNVDWNTVRASAARLSKRRRLQVEGSPSHLYHCYQIAVA